MRAHRKWWLDALVVRKIVAARMAVQHAWDVVGRERSLEVVPFSRPAGVPAPRKSDYRRLLRKSFTPCIEPAYVSGRLVPPEVQAALGLDLFRTRHLRPVTRCTIADFRAVIPWEVQEIPPPPTSHRGLLLAQICARLGNPPLIGILWSVACWSGYMMRSRSGW